MSDDVSVNGSSCLAITEKKNNEKQSGGCVGIFFQLFDWNRRFTKKRFFSKKLLPPANAKQNSMNKFKGDEKMPNSKLHLIANGNNGGLSDVMEGGNHVIEVVRKHEMKAPSIVARLMGLETIPVSKRDESKKSLFLDSVDGEESLEIGVANASPDSRPQKVRKMEVNGRRAITRFGAEALQNKSVLSQVRKSNHHHSHRHAKFVSPLKSPRVSSGKSVFRSSRLIEAATKILEPGLQATSRSKYSLTSSISKCPRKNHTVTDTVGTPAEAIHNRSCKNCGDLLDVEICKPIVSGVFTHFSSESAQKVRSFNPSHENDVVLLRSQEKIITLVNEDVKKNAYPCNEPTSRRIHVHAKCDSSRQPRGGIEDDDYTSFNFECKTQTRERMLSDERMAFRSEARNSNMQEKRASSAATASTVCGSKDFVGLNRSLSSRTWIRSPTKLDSCKFDLERKKRTLNVSQVEGIASVNLVTSKHRNVGSNSQGGKRRNFDAFSPYNSNVKCRKSGYQKTDKINDNKINKVETISANEIKTCFQRHHSPLREDVLGAFLEQKLKELKSRDNEKLANCDQPRRSTALILQELISVLNAGSGYGFHTGSKKISYDQPERFEHDVKLLDSATLFNTGKIGCEILTELVNRIHSILQSLNSFWPRLLESKLNHMKDVIFMAELVLGNVTRQSEDLPELLISCILVDEVDNMATDAMRRNFNRSQLKGFLFDCVIEYLESNCCRNYYNVLKSLYSWTKAPQCMKGEILVEEVKSEIKKWEFIAGVEPDKIIDWDMSYSLGKWTDFNVEAFEFGVDIEDYVLQILVDEIVEDLEGFRHGTF